MKVTMASERLLRTVVDEGLEHFICDDGKGIYAVRKDEVKIVQEWVDVTHECTLEASAHGAYCIYRLGSVIHPGNTAHRVTCKGSTFKVEVKR